MFLFVIKYLGFFKHIPGLAIVFDAWLKVYTLIVRPELLDLIDEIELEVSNWPEVTAGTHKYGGLQFNYFSHEVGHIHSNGLTDILLSRKVKQQLMEEGRILDHHTFINSGWISFYIRNENDRDYAIDLLKLSYTTLLKRKGNPSPVMIADR